MQDNVARKAIEVLAERGWHQGDYFGPDGSACLLGAVNRACGLGRSAQWWDGTDFECRAAIDTELLLCEIAREQFPDRLPNANIIAKFNDHPDTTLADVLLVLDKAAVRLDEQAS